MIKNSVTSFVGNPHDVNCVVQFWCKRRGFAVGSNPDDILKSNPNGASHNQKYCFSANNEDTAFMLGSLSQTFLSH